MKSTITNFLSFCGCLLVVLVAIAVLGCSDDSSRSSGPSDLQEEGIGQSGSMSTPGNQDQQVAGAAGISTSTAGSTGAGQAAIAGTGAPSNAGDSTAGSDDAGSGPVSGSGVAGAAGVSGSAGVAGTTPDDPQSTGDVERVDNPYEGAKGYVNPEWQAKANGEPGGDRISNTPTGVWIDRIAAIEGTPNSQSNGPMGVRDHLDEALSQSADYIQFVIYDLPGRDCSALASNGELGVDELPRYKSEYIDPIVSIMADSKYRNLRIINIIEIDSLPNLVTNTNVAKCAEMQSNGGYVQGVAYALQELGSLPNTYNYVDAGHHGWLGWDTNFDPSAQLFAETANIAGMHNVHGFITNTANYSALVEPYFDINTTVNGQTIRESSWVDWNQYVDELSFAQAFREKLVSLGFDANIGMLIDTSRNGWGGTSRPTSASTSTDLNSFVNESRIDRRIHAGNWCNQAGAGLGERPRANPEPGIDAYVWIKPPGESDGSSSLIPNDDGKGFDEMCDPTYGGNDRNGNSTTGALPDAPISGAWFSAQFQELMRNAHPPL